MNKKNCFEILYTPESSYLKLSNWKMYVVKPPFNILKWVACLETAFNLLIAMFLLPKLATVGI